MQESVQLRRSRPTLLTQLKSFFISHLQTAVAALGRLSRAPLSSLLTAAVLGIALALPAGLNVLLKQVQQFSGGLDSINQISVFLKQDASERDVLSLQQQLQGMMEVASTEHISPQQALTEFENHSGFGEALQALDQNPLPHVLVIHPSLGHSEPQQVNQLLAQLQQMPAVDMAQLDIKWLQRLYALLDIGHRAVVIIATLLAVAVLLIIGNTIRLAIENRRSEIVVTKLIGGTDAFIRRPFLYTGAWYGLAGGILATLLVDISLLMLNQPVEHLTSLYNDQVTRLSLMGFADSVTVIASGTALGLAGAWLAVSRHLKDIEPQ